MSKRPTVQRLRDGIFVVGAFAMVLYVTVGDHRRSGSNRQLEAGIVGGGSSQEVRPDDRVAFIRSEDILP